MKLKGKGQLAAETRFAQMRVLEDELHASGFTHVAGLDEAGRGPLAGPVCVAACILNPEKPIWGLNDSKKLSEKQRLMLFDEIVQEAVATAVVWREPERIDEINILEATREAMTEAAEKLQPSADYLLLDAMRLPASSCPQRSLVQGDAQVNAIAAASILAKVSRDRYMQAVDLEFPGYGFAQHKGYGTASHYEALRRLGPCPIHRLSFLKKLKLGGTVLSTKVRGQAAEHAVAQHLEKQGYQILIQNFELRPFGEMDLLCRKGEALYALEVKARRHDPEAQKAEWAFTEEKRRRVRRLAEYFADSRNLSFSSCHLLLAAVDLDEEDQVKHIHYMEAL